MSERPGGQEHQDRIVRIFSEKLHLDVGVDTDLIETGVLDSFTFVELLLHLEQDCGLRVTFEDLEIDHFRSVKKIAEVVAANAGKPAEVQGRGAAA